MGVSCQYTLMVDIFHKLLVRRGGFMSECLFVREFERRCYIEDIYITLSDIKYFDKKISGVFEFTRFNKR